MADVGIVAQVRRFEHRDLHVGSDLLELLRGVALDGREDRCELLLMLSLIPRPGLLQRLAIADARQQKQRRLHADLTASAANDRALAHRKVASLDQQPSAANAAQPQRTFAINR